MCVKWREGPGGMNLHRDVNVPWEEDTCAPLDDGMETPFHCLPVRGVLLMGSAPAKWV